MKRNSRRFLALFLSGTMAFLPTLTPNAASSETVEESAQNPEESEGEAQQAASSEAAVPSENQEAPQPEQTAEAATEAAAPAAGENTAEAESPKAAETPGETKAEEAEAEKQESEKSQAEESASAEKEKTEDSKETPNQEVKPEAAKTEENTSSDTQESTTQFHIVDSGISQSGETITVSISTDNLIYDKIFVGSKDADPKEPVVEGKENALGGYTFEFPVAKEQLGQKIPYVPRYTDSDKWCTTEEYYLQLPEEIAGASEEKTSPEDVQSETSDCKYTNEGETPKGDASDLFLEESAPAGGASYTMTDYPGTTSPVDNATTLADGEYVPESFEFSGGTGKTKITCGKLKVTSGKAYAVITFSSTSWSYVKAGGELFQNGTVDGDSISYEIPIALNANNTIIGLTTKMTEPHEIEYVICAKITEPPASENPGDQPTPTPAAQATPTPTPAVSPTAAPKATPTPTPASGKKTVKEGNTYSINVKSSASMFRVVACELTKKNGKMTAVLTLSGEGYDYLYMGTKEQALKAKKSKWIPYKLDAEGKYTYEIPVSALDKPIKVAARSKRYAEEGAAQPWYDRELTFQSSTLKKISGPDSTPTPTPKPKKTPTPTPTAAPSKGTGGGSTGGSTGGSSTSAVNTSTKLEDGVYTPDSFSWSGGSGRLKGISCEKITIKNGQAWATIVFASSSYDAIRANGQEFGGTISGDSATFEIPVQLNANNAIVGRTTKMSQPHWVEYSIYIGLEAAKKASGSGSGSSSKSGGSTTTVIDSIESSYKDSNAPEITGVEYVGSLEVEHAEYFKLHYYEDDIAVLEIDASTDAERGKKAAETEDANVEVSDGEEGSAPVQTESHYSGDTLEYLLVPEGTELPAGMGEEMNVISIPAEKAYVDSDNGLKILDKINASDKINAVGMEKEEISTDSILKAMEDGSIIFAGDSENLDFKELVKNKCDLVIVPADILHQDADEEDKVSELGDQLSLLKIPMIIDRSSEEKDEAGKYEWCKVYGALFGCQEEAREVYESSAAALKTGEQE